MKGGRKESRGRRGRTGQEGRDGLDSGDEKQKAEEDDSYLRQIGRVQNDPAGGESEGRRSRGRDEADPERRGRVCDTARESAEDKRKSESCGVTDGCTIQVTSRMRGGGVHKDKECQKERKRTAKPKGPEKSVKGPATQECDMDTVVWMIQESEENWKVMVRMLEENADNRKMIENMSEGSDAEMEQTLQIYPTASREVLSWNQEQV